MAQSTYFTTGLLLVGLFAGTVTIPSGAAESVNRLSVMRPQGVEFPRAWTFLAAAPATHVWGLTQYLYHVDASASAVQHWARQPNNGCEDGSDLAHHGNSNSSVTSTPAALDIDLHSNHQSFTLLWFCADATRLYSFLQWHTTVLWAVSERPTEPEDTADNRFAEFLRGLGAEQVHQSSTAFEQLNVYHTGRTLLALQADLHAYVKRYGLQVNDHQTAHNGLVMSWQQGPLRTQISAVRQADGRVVLTQMTGTNL